MVADGRACKVKILWGCIGCCEMEGKVLWFGVNRLRENKKLVMLDDNMAA